MSEKEKFHGSGTKLIKSSLLGPGKHIHLFPEKPKQTIKTLKKLSVYLLKYKVYFLTSIVCAGFTSFLSLLGPFLTGKAIDNYIIPKNLIHFPQFLLLMFFIYVFNASFTYIQSLIMTKFSQKIGFDLRKDAFEQIHNLSLKVIDRRQVGDIMSRITNDIDMITTTLATSAIQLFTGILMLSGTIIMMVTLSPLLTFYSLILIPLMATITKIITSRTRKYFYLQQEKLGEVNGIVEEDITGLEIIKIYGKEESEIKKFEEKNLELRKYGIMAQKFAGIMGPLMNFLNNVSFAIIGGIGGIFVVREIITIGTIVSFISYVKQFTRPLHELAHQFNAIQSAIAGAERVFEIMEEEKEKEDREDTVEIEEIKEKIEFKNLYFAYEDEKYVLKNINFKVNPGKIIAIVGPTGAGKTTLINLLARLYEIEKGEILLDDIDIRKIKKESLRNILGVVLQDTYLFAETIRENIRYGNLSATDEEIETICKKINAHQFISTLPQKYNTIILDGGQSLSHGQRQLIAIARTLLSNPKILILDEATSNIDTKTESNIQRGLQELMNGKTTFIIAHRLNTIKNADLILVINEGEIIESGTHEELMKKKGFYYKFYTTYYT